MAYCPKCLTEYEPDTAECMDCHVALKPGKPTPAEVEKEAEKKTLVRLRVFTGKTAPLDAGLAKNVLEAEGIPCALPGEWEGYPGTDAVQLLVREIDAARAEEILEGYLDRLPEGAPSDETQEK